MIKKITAFISFVLLTFCINPAGFDTVDTLNHDGKHQQAFELLKNTFNKADPDPAVLWRMGREIFELAENIPNNSKAEKIAKYTEALNLLEPYLTINKGTNFDMANIVFFYSSNLGSRGKVIGIGESLGQLPELKRLADKTLELDPTFGLAYLLKAKIEDEVPFILGGDKYKMGVFYTLALKYETNNLTVIFDAGKAFYERNWNSDKKIKTSDKNTLKDPSPLNIDDRAYAKQILQRGIPVYKSIKNPSDRDNKQYAKILKLLESIK